MVTDSYTFNQLIKQYQKDAQGVSLWEKYLTGLSETYEQGEQAIQEKTGYDISGAYANYKKSQLNLLHNQKLGTGLKEQLSSDLQSSYASAYGELKSAEAEQIQKLQSSITSAYTSAEKQVAQSAEQLSKITDYLYEFGNIDTSLLEKSREAGGLGYFETSDGETRLTSYGKAGLGALMYQGKDGKTFTDYLYEADRDLYDWYMNNLDLARGTIAGFEPGTTSFNKTASDTMIAAEDAERKYATLYPSSYDKTKTFNSEQERLDYYQKAISVNLSKDIVNKYTYDYITNKNKRANYSGLDNSVSPEIKQDIENVTGGKVSYINTLNNTTNNTKNIISIIHLDVNSLDENTINKLKKAGISVPTSGQVDLRLNTTKITYKYAGTTMTFDDFFKIFSKGD